MCLALDYFLTTKQLPFKSQLACPLKGGCSSKGSHAVTTGNPKFFTNLLEVGIVRDFGALKGVRTVRTDDTNVIM